MSEHLDDVFEDEFLDVILSLFKLQYFMFNYYKILSNKSNV